MKRGASLISALLRRAWLIDPTWASENMPQVVRLLQGKQVDFGMPEQRSSEERVAILSAVEGSGLYAPSYYSGFQNAPKGSLAFIDVTGPILKYGFCGAGSYELQQLTKEAIATPNIKGIFYNLDTPGGQVDGIASFGDVIRNSPKPTLGFVDDGMMCSGGTWIGTSCDECYASQDLDTIGSIGVYQTIYDQRDYLKKAGIKKLDRYAPQSTEKNKTYRTALDGDYKMLDEELSAIADKFINTIIGNRGDRLKGGNEQWGKGQTGSAIWAQKVGLIDGILNFDAAVARLEALCAGEKSYRSTSSAPTNKAQSLTTDMKFEKLAALAGKETVTQEELDEVNAELTAAGITGHGVYPETLATEAADVTKERDELKTTNATLTTELDTAKGSVARLNGEVATLKAKVAAAPAAGSTAKGKEDPKTEKTAAELAEEKVSGFAHNQYADQFLID